MSSDRALRVLDALLEVVFAAVIAWLPIAFGGVLPTSGHLVLVGGAATLAALYAVRIVWAGEHIAWTHAAWLLVAFVGLVGLQRVAGSADWLQGLAPQNHKLWHDLLAEPPLPGDMPAVPLTLDPGATTTDLRLLASLLVLFVVGVHVLRTRDALRRWLVVMTTIGALVAALAVAQTLSGASELWFLWKTPGNHATAGPFVHYGHFSQFTNLAIGCALALVMLRMAERDRSGELEVQDLVRDLGAPDRRPDLALYAFVILGAVAIALSRSRNGMLSMLVGGALCAGLLQRTRYVRGMGWTFVGLLVLAFAALLVAGFDPVYERLQTLEDDQVYNFRLAIARDALAAFTHFPWLGSGQGTFGAIFPLYDTSTRPGFAEHAENQYVELLVETGVLGALLMVTFLVAIAVPWWRRLRQRRGPGDVALFGLVFGTTAVLMHATSDFGLRIPAVAATLTGTLAAVAARSAPQRAATGVQRLLFAMALVGIAVALALQGPVLVRQGQAHDVAAMAKAQDERAQHAETYEALEEVRDRQRNLCGIAVTLDPTDADLQLAYAVAVWKSIVAKTRVDTLQRGEEMPADVRARLTKWADLTSRALGAARVLCPIRGELWSMLGQFGGEYLAEPQAPAWIERGFRFAPHNPQTTVAWARQLLKAGDRARAAEMFARALQLGGNSTRQLQTLVQDGELELAAQVARTNPRWLYSLWAVSRKDHAEFAATLAPDLDKALRPLTEGNDGPAYAYSGLADLLTQQGDKAAAIPLWRRYLVLQPRSGARLTLARILREQGDKEGARREVQRLLNYDPTNGGAKNLLKELGQ